MQRFLSYSIYQSILLLSKCGKCILRTLLSAVHQHFSFFTAIKASSEGVWHPFSQLPQSWKQLGEVKWNLGQYDPMPCPQGTEVGSSLPWMESSWWSPNLV